MNVYLIGYRGTGKSTIGQRLAQRLGRPFADSDDEIERITGQSIAALFSEEGETAFRNREEKVVADLARREGYVIALGGGAILRENNQQLISRNSRIIWLTASAESIAKRIATDVDSPTRRPPLTAEGGMREIELLLAAREPLYRKTATDIIDTEGRSVEAILDAILPSRESH